MVVSFDKYGNYETPAIILCNPGTVLNNGTPTLARGEIPLASDIELVFNFNEMSELSFRTYYIPDNQEGWLRDVNDDMIDIYDAIQKYRYLFIEDIGFFRIDETIDTTEGGYRTKDVRAVSCEVELKSPLIPYIPDGTYPLVGYNAETGMTGVLDSIISKAPLWSIGHIDTSLGDMNRSFENVDVSKDIYTFLTQDIQDAYECIVLFDTLNRTVNVYDNKHIGTPTNIHLTRDDLVEVIKITDSSDGPYTAFRIFGDEAMSIAAVNPLGGNTVYNFNAYLSWMSSELAEKVSEWQDAVHAVENEYYSIGMDYYDCVADLSDAQAEIDRLNIQLDLYQKCIDNMYATSSTVPVIECNEKLSLVDGTQILLNDTSVEVVASSIRNLIDEVNSDIATATEEYNSLSQSMSVYEQQRKAIYDSVNMDTYFTTEQKAELSAYIFENTYTDSYVTLDSTLDVASQIQDMDLIYERAKNALNSMITPPKEFTIDTEDFLFVEKFLPWIEQLKTGCLVNIEIDDKTLETMFMSTMEVNYEDKSTRLIFGNKLDKFDNRTLFNSIFGDIVKKVTIPKDDGSATPNDGYMFIVTSSGLFITTNDDRFIVAEKESE